MLRQALSLTVLCCLTLLSASALAADSKGKTFTNAKQAGPDFAIQGEYAGTVVFGDTKDAIGAQVIALGDGKFDAVFYKGGLPGKGWNRGEPSEKLSGQLKDGVVTFSKDKDKIELRNGVMTAFAENKMVGEFKKVTRTSPTLGAKPPQGAIVLFDGKSADKFDNGKIVEENLLGATNCESKKKLGDHTLHIEFRTPFMPAARGQGRGNSGVYVQGRYEVQVLDSFGLEGKNNECGGIYSIAQPDVNMCLPALSWQTYDIDFTAARYDDDGKKTKNARVTIRHNGVVIHDDVELTHGTPGRHKEGPSPSGLFLQNHGNPVAFRNIWVVEKK